MNIFMWVCYDWHIFLTSFLHWVTFFQPLELTEFCPNFFSNDFAHALSYGSSELDERRGKLPVSLIRLRHDTMDGKLYATNSRKRHAAIPRGNLPLGKRILQLIFWSYRPSTYYRWPLDIQLDQSWKRHHACLTNRFRGSFSLVHCFCLESHHRTVAWSFHSKFYKLYVKDPSARLYWSIFSRSLEFFQM